MIYKAIPPIIDTMHSYHNVPDYIPYAVLYIHTTIL